MIKVYTYQRILSLLARLVRI